MYFQWWKRTNFDCVFLKFVPVYRINNMPAFGSDNVDGYWGAFLRLWPPSTMWDGSFNLNNAIFFNLGLCAVCWAHFVCHHELWPTSVGHPFSFLNSSWGLTGGKHYQKITIAVFRFVLQNFTIPGYFSYIPFSLHSSVWFVIAVCGFMSVRGTS